MRFGTQQFQGRRRWGGPGGQALPQIFAEKNSRKVFALKY